MNPSRGQQRRDSRMRGIFRVSLIVFAGAIASGVATILLGVAAIIDWLAPQTVDRLPDRLQTIFDFAIKGWVFFPGIGLALLYGGFAFWQWGVTRDIATKVEPSRQDAVRGAALNHDDE